MIKKQNHHFGGFLFIFLASLKYSEYFI